MEWLDLEKQATKTLEKNSAKYSWKTKTKRNQNKKTTSTFFSAALALSSARFNWSFIMFIDRARLSWFSSLFVAGEDNLKIWQSLVWLDLHPSEYRRQRLSAWLVQNKSPLVINVSTLLTKSDFYLFCALHSDFDIMHQVNQKYLKVYGGRWVWLLAPKELYTW